jgi:thymidylate kinase
MNLLGRLVEMRHLKPVLVSRRGCESVSIVLDPHGKPPRSVLFSVAKICVWLLEEWYAYSFQESKETLLICDRYYHDLLIDPKRYRYGGPTWGARLIGKLMPQPKLWVLLDAPAEILQVRKQEVPPTESARQREEYLAFVCKQRNHVIVNASQSLDKVIADVETAIQATTRKEGGNCR